jgi:hypothetical protein
MSGRNEMMTFGRYEIRRKRWDCICGITTGEIKASPVARANAFYLQHELTMEHIRELGERVKKSVRND